MSSRQFPTVASTRPACGCATPKPIRWAWSTMRTISSGLKLDESNCCGNWASPIETWNANDDCFIAVVDARCRYKAPAHYDDEIIVRTWLKNVRESVIHFGYELVRATTATLLAEGETTHIVTDSKMKVTALPEKYLKVFRAAVKTSATEN